MATGTTTIAPGFEITDRISPSILNNLVTHLIITISGVTAADLNADAVTTEKIKNKAVTTAKLADGAVTKEKIAEKAVSTDKLEDGAVTGEKIVDGTITGAKIEAGSITLDKLAANSSGAMLGEVRYLAMELLTEGADGWVYADGSEKNTTDYPDMVTAIVGGRWKHGSRLVGSVYYFTLPKLNHFVRGWYPGIEADTTGGTARLLGGIQTESVGTHTHRISVTTDTKHGSPGSQESSRIYLSAANQSGIMASRSGGDACPINVFDKEKYSPTTPFSGDIGMLAAASGDVHPANVSLAVVVYLGKKAAP